MSSLTLFFIIIGFLILSAAGWISLELSSRIRRIKELESTIDKLRKTLDEMDEQANLIIRTDMELNKTQEELDKKLNGLYALQRISREIATSLEEREIFNNIRAEYLEELGFERAIAFLWNDKTQRFTLYLCIGYTEEDTNEIKASVDHYQALYIDLVENEKGISSISLAKDTATRATFNRIFKVHSFVISPISPIGGNKGFIFVGTDRAETVITEGDEEVITILANQLGQALENARLFEKNWKAQNELEKKVEERTRELSLALDEVKKVSKRKTDFISSVSHELRTPLTSIKGYASILLTGKLGEVNNEIKERLERMNRHCDELVHMVNDLLDIARIESGKAAMQFEEHDVKSIIDSISDLISVQCKSKNIELAMSFKETLPPVYVDRTQIERVFINLLGNAVKFTPEGGKITVAASVIDKFVRISITDTGIGIPPEAIPKLFQEFYRADNAINSAIKGTGLGLSLVKNIVEAHKGRITVESKLNQETVFSFSLPLK
jgi:signal transduction histidine kinase